MKKVPIYKHTLYDKMLYVCRQCWKIKYLSKDFACKIEIKKRTIVVDTCIECRTDNPFAYRQVLLGDKSILIVHKTDIYFYSSGGQGKMSEDKNKIQKVLNRKINPISNHKKKQMLIEAKNKQTYQPRKFKHFVPTKVSDKYKSQRQYRNKCGKVTVSSTRERECEISKD